MTHVQQQPHDTPDPNHAPAAHAPAIRWSTVLVVVGLAAVAFYVSYRHLLDLARGYGEPADTARLFPLTVDGLIIAASLVLLHSARADLPVPVLARFALWLGIGSTIVGNAAHGIAHGWQGALVSAASAVALVIAYELLMGLIRTIRKTAPAEPVIEVVYRDRTIEVEVEREVMVLPADRFEAARLVIEEAAAGGRRLPGRRALADRWGIEIREAVEILDQIRTDRNTVDPEQSDTEAGRDEEAAA